MHRIDFRLWQKHLRLARQEAIPFMKLLTRIGLTLTIAVLIVTAPLWVLISRTDVTGPRSATSADAALVFGAVVRQDRISPLHAERLDTAVRLYRAGKVDSIVVSNAPRAARIMAEYLLSQNVPERVIEVDATALKTPQTCVAERNRSVERSLILVSQRFHLPRIAYQCRKLGVTGQYIAADDQSFLPRQAPQFTTLLRVRGMRYVREAILVWASLLEFYPVKHV